MKPFAIYFPQFYSIPVNEKAWGAYFTDWTLVANANLHQLWDRRAPQRGYYDGSSCDIHLEQLAEAHNSGLAGFGVYHYWFYTHQELGAFEHTLRNNKNSQQSSWFLIWASESWSKRWVGDATELINLSKTPTDYEVAAHCEYLAQSFASPHYYKWRGRYFFVIYNLSHFTNPQNVVDQYRNEFIKRGLEVAIVCYIKNPFEVSYTTFVDAVYLFEPRLFFGFANGFKGNSSKYLFDKFNNLFGSNAAEKLLVLADSFKPKSKTYTEQQFLKYLNSQKRQEFSETIKISVQTILSPGWNNTPRYGERFTALEPLSDESFSFCLKNSIKSSDLPPLINAWNEWSEGAAIEPCVYYGRRYLDEINKIRLLES